MRKISFSKYSGCGNDFILIDNRSCNFPIGDELLIQDLCRRSLGIGADGLILLEESTKADYRMRIFNADGGEAEMCGNGLRCFGMFINELGIPGSHFDVEVTEKIYPVSTEANRVSVAMVPPSQMEWEVDVTVDDKLLRIDFLDTGVPHVVQFVEDIEIINLETLGPSLRYHQRFAPKGTNVDFASLSSQNIIYMRTYERGVEGETLACGTGAAAVAIAAARKYGLKSPITVKTRSGECLDFDLKIKDDQIESIVMMGPANQIYSGIVEV